MMLNKKFLVVALVLLAFAGKGLAFTAIASIDGHVHDAWFRSNNYTSQKEADSDALEGCRVEARKNGLASLAHKCKVSHRAKGPGYGSIVCGEGGCAWVTGYESGQAAVDGAFDECNRSYKNCQEKDIRFWEDFAGFPANKKPVQVSEGNCRPRTPTIRCQSSCTNGDCIVTYENGCKMRVQVSPKFDGSQNRWVYPAPAC